MASSTDMCDDLNQAFIQDTFIDLSLSDMSDISDMINVSSINHTGSDNETICSILDQAFIKPSQDLNKAFIRPPHRPSTKLEACIIVAHETEKSNKKR